MIALHHVKIEVDNRSGDRVFDAFRQGLASPRNLSCATGMTYTVEFDTEHPDAVRNFGLLGLVGARVTIIEPS